MKVLMVDQIAKVSYKYSFSMTNALKRAGVCVDLAIDQKKEQEDSVCSRINLFNTDEKNIGKLKKLVNYFSSWRKIKKLIKNKYDILHTQWVIFSPVDYWFLRKIKKQEKKLVITIHDILPFNKKFYDYFFHNKIYGLADAIILQTDENVSKFHDIFPKIQSPVYMVPHGHFMNYAKVLDMQMARKKLNLPEKEFIYLFFGQIKKVKGVDVLLKSYADLLKNHPEIKKNTLLVIAGNTWKEDSNKYFSLVKQEHLDEYVHMDIRYIPDDQVDLFYSAADVCVLPYLEVYQSGVLQLTYAHHRVPIATDLRAFTDIINPQIGFICRSNDIQALSNAMRIAYNKKNELETMANCGYNYIATRFDWDNIAIKVKEIYTEVEKHVQEA